MRDGSPGRVSLITRFGVEALPAGDLERILSAFPRLRMKERFAETVTTTSCATSADDSVPGYKAVSTVDLLMNAPFDE